MKKMQNRLILLVILSVVLLSACSTGRNIEGALNWNVKSYTYTDQDGKAFGSADLKGKVYIANFIFTTCETVCPPITANMARLQKMVKDKNIDVEFVSFSVDPEVDTPSMLKTFAGKFTQDLSNWHFLTGYSQQDIEEFSKNSFRTLVDKPQSSDQVIHGTSIYLVDKNGKVMKSYNGLKNTPYDEIIQDITILNKK
ncbi:SCO family protein [Bacillus sp. 165]|uniref:SCO family protein n=1 Tax=Bacillus sp. 165 TaxID=1529117 RepID=UPI001ADD18DB|nr:SCO family protein [Bacillus sp. 165]MBO9129334.1 SCO family protein [Bacillus sp. 165]